MDKEHFRQTTKALEELNTALGLLNNIVAGKKDALEKRHLAMSEEKLRIQTEMAEKQRKAQELSDKVSVVVEKINMVLKDNGASNNHN